MKKILFFLLLALNTATAESHIPKALVTSLTLIYPPQDVYKNLKGFFELQYNPVIRQRAIIFYQNPTNNNCEDLLNQIMENFGMKSKRNFFDKFISRFYKDEYSISLERIKNILIVKDSYLEQKNIDFITDFLKRWYNEYKENNSNFFSNEKIALKIMKLNKKKDAFKSDQPKETLKNDLQKDVLKNEILKKTKDALSPSSLNDIKSAQKVVSKGLQAAYKLFLTLKRYAR